MLWICLTCLIIGILNKLIQFETVLSILFKENQLEVMRKIHPRFIIDTFNSYEVKQKFRFYENKEITKERLEKFNRALNNIKKDKIELSK